MTLRVLIVDDSALYRQLVKNVLRDVPRVEVVGQAKTGAEALERLAECNPHLLTLDVQMPDMNGLEVLHALKKMPSTAKAIMLSSLTGQGTQVTTDALLAGAFDFIQKPNGNDASANRVALLESLSEKIGTIRESLEIKMPRRASTNIAEPTARRGRIAAVVIGTSTGGPVALREVLPKLPTTLKVPIFVVQHMPARYTKSLANRLNESSLLPVQEALDGMKIEPNMVYIAPGGLQMCISKSPKGTVIKTVDDPPENNCKPAVDYLFRSAAEVYGGNLLAVILTGMGRDGTEGCRIIKQLGGSVIAQHPEGCVVYGMPKAVVEEQLADRVIPLEKIASWIVRIVESKE